MEQHDGLGRDELGHGGQEHGVRDGLAHDGRVRDGLDDEALGNMVLGQVNMELDVQEQGEHKAQVGQLPVSPHGQDDVLQGQELLGKMGQKCSVLGYVLQWHQDHTVWE